MTGHLGSAQEDDTLTAILLNQRPGLLSRATIKEGSRADLQTIALPTELPLRERHFTRKLVSESNVWMTNGLSN
jgi:hypothetical protein